MKRRPGEPGSDVGEGSQPGIGDTDDVDALQLLQIVNRREYGIIERSGFTVEVDILYAFAAANRRVVEARLEKQVDQRRIL